MNTKTITDKKERKAAKRTARKKADAENPKKPRAADVARGSMKKKVPKMVKGQRKR